MLNSLELWKSEDAPKVQTLELTRSIDGYCERLGPEYWAEPVNAVTNLAFLLAALFMWRRSSGFPLARALCIVLFAIGLGSYLFHTHAVTWAAIADVTPIAMFILLYLFAINRDGIGLRLWPALGVTGLFFPYAAMMTPLFSMLPGLGGSAAYAPVALLILLYAAFLRGKMPELSRGLAIGGFVLVVSLVFRTIDEPLCSTLPLGTHFLWHILNGLMLGWMIEVYIHTAKQKPLLASD